MMIRRGPSRSSSWPSLGEAIATDTAAKPKALETASRLQPNSAPTGFRKTENVKTTSEPKPAITPKNAARTTSQPYPGLCVLGDFMRYELEEYPSAATF